MIINFTLKRPLWLISLAGSESSLGNDDVLMKSIIDQDSIAMGTLFDRHAGSVFAVCLRMVERADAEEIVSEVFWHLWTHPKRLDLSRGSVPSYLITMARSRAMDRIRTSGRRRKILDGFGPTAIQETIHAAPDGGDPFGTTAEKELRQHVSQALSSLNPTQREAIELSFYGAMSHQEIATSLNQPLGTIKTRIRTGLVHLRESLTAYYGAEKP